MSHSDYLNPIVSNSIDDLEWKPAKEIPTSVVYKQRPAFWRFRDRFDPLIEFG
jgi:hypothetical protein